MTFNSALSKQLCGPRTSCLCYQNTLTHSRMQRPSATQFNQVRKALPSDSTGPASFITSTLAALSYSNSIRFCAYAHLHNINANMRSRIQVKHTLQHAEHTHTLSLQSHIGCICPSICARAKTSASCAWACKLYTWLSPVHVGNTHAKNTLSLNYTHANIPHTYTHTYRQWDPSRRRESCWHDAVRDACRCLCWEPLRCAPKHVVDGSSSLPDHVWACRLRFL